MITNIVSIDKRTARTFLLQTQHLWSNRAEKSGARESRTRDLIESLECVQLDPVAAVERNHHLVLHARNGTYQTNDLEQLIGNGSLFEYVANAACLIPVEDYPIFEPIRNQYRLALGKQRSELAPVIAQIKERLAAEGPLPSRAFRSDRLVRGYWDNTVAKTKETTLALNVLLDTGEITVARRVGSERFYSLTEQHIPDSLRKRADEIEEAEAKMALAEKYMRAYRIFDFEDSRFGWYKTSASERKQLCSRFLAANKIVPLHIEGVRREYYILAEDVATVESISRDQAPSPKIVRFLPPLDNLLWRRPRLEDLFSFSYKWEIYFPESKREFGYYAMPILYKDMLIGRMDPRCLREQKKLVIRRLHLENGVRISKTLVSSLQKGLLSFARFHQANDIVVEQSVPEQLRDHLTF
ncbi:winged helix-turn-helix domain-containing protein [Brevibacillus sp. TJ4]|uniref:winged helix-turn-helix domain-containing protein n=1 Tax=Brevibacillus sp. TJ4 TaxID=3234853 RepID=UPI0037D2FB30